MIKFYKDLFILYMTVAMAGACPLLLWGILELNGAATVLAIIVALVYMFIVVVLFTQKANKRYKNLLEIMLNQCKCQECLNGHLKYKFKNGKSNKRLNAIIHLNMAFAHTNLGEIDKARAIIEKVTPSDLGKKFWAHNIDFLRKGHKVTCCLLCEDISGAKAILSEMKEIAANPVFNDNARNTHHKVCTSLEAKIAVLQGEHQKAQTLLEICLEQDEHMLSKARTSYYLALAYKGTGNAEKAQEHFKFAAKNGGDSIYARLADDSLKL